MPLYVIAACALVASSLVVLVYALTAERDFDPVRANLGPRNPLQDSRQIALSASARSRLLDPIFDALSDRFRSVGSAGLARRVDRKLALAGLKETGWTVERVLVLRAFALLGGIVLAFMALTSLAGRQGIGMALLVLGVGYLGPEAWLDRKAGERQGIIEKQLPDVIDQLTISVEAGLGFDAAMAKSAEGRSGPMAVELGRVLQDIQVGVDRQVALDRLIERTDVPDLKAFVVAIRQSTRHGLPIARVLNIQSQELREKRRARVEEKAAQLPVKIVFPLVFCILPSLFVVILGPAGIGTFKNF